jgi:hypothetical protein
MNSMITDQKNEFKEYLDTTKEIDNLPNGISISTMCATCKLNTELDIDNIEHNLQLNKNDIITVKRSTTSIRTLLMQKKKIKEQKKMYNLLKQK